MALILGENIVTTYVYRWFPLLLPIDMAMSELPHREFCSTWPYTISFHLLCCALVPRTYHACFPVPLVSFPDSGLAHIPYRGFGNETTVPPIIPYTHMAPSVCAWKWKHANHSYLILMWEKILGSPCLHNFNVCVPERGSLGMRLGYSLTLVVNCILCVPNLNLMRKGALMDLVETHILCGWFTHLVPSFVACGLHVALASDGSLARRLGTRLIEL